MRVKINIPVLLFSFCCSTGCPALAFLASVSPSVKPACSGFQRLFPVQSLRPLRPALTMAGDSEDREHDRRQLLRRGLSLSFAGMMTAAAAPSQAGAICGSKPQSWEFWIPVLFLCM